MENINFFLGLIYGYALITMGIFVLRQKAGQLTQVYFARSLKYLGLFGITHGLSEWVSMIVSLELYPEWQLFIINTNQVLEALSFTFLMVFGLDISTLKSRIKRVICKLPIVLFLFYLTGFTFLIYRYGLDYHLDNPGFNTVALCYLLGFPSCLITAVALNFKAQNIKRTGAVQVFQRYQSLAIVFLGYGILEALLGSKIEIVAANALSNKIFFTNLKSMVLLFKALFGFVIIYFLFKVLDTFNWEQREKMRLLEMERIAAEERRKLGLEIHDSIIQKLYGAGLKVEYLLHKKANRVDTIIDADEDIQRAMKLLEEIKDDLTNAINTTRDFISTSTLEKIRLEDLSSYLEQWIKDFTAHHPLKISLNSRISPYHMGYISPEKSTQIYYVVQEALTNIVKHSEADTAEVLLEGTYDYLYISIEDNGKGIDFAAADSAGHLGIRSMKERTARAGGVFVIERLKNGTRIELKIPWEESKGDGKDQSVNR